MKKILTVFTGLFLMLTLVFSVSAEGNAKMSLKSNKTELSRGDKFTITVSLKNDQPVSNGGVVLSYDTAAFQLLGGDCKVKNATLGEVSVSRNGGVFVMQTDEVVSGTIFTIQMQVKEDAPFGEFSISGDPSLNIGCTLSGTKVTVVCPHDYSTGTKIDEEDHEAVCSICGDKKEEDHIWDKGTVTLKATCQSYGKKDVTCTICGAQGEKNVSMLPHTNDYENLEGEGHRYTCKKCGETGIETHSYPDTWEHDANEHYRACAECGYQRERAAHVPGPVATETTAQTCTVCERVLKASMDHEHIYGEEWVSDETSHWYKCTACDATRDQAEHRFDSDCDASCNVCGFTRQPPHNLGDWSGDNSSHWKICAGCGQRLELAKHTASPENAGVCEVCDKKLVDPNHKHDFSSAHSHVCACGEVKEGTGQFCEVCGVFPWWVLCIAEAVLFAGILLIVIQKRKKEEDYLD